MSTIENSEQKYYSQTGEDEILFEIFQGKQQGLCIEVGGFNGVDASNSYFFEKLGWRCIVVEPIPELCQQIRSRRNCLLFNCAAGAANGETKFYVHEQDPIVSSLKFTKVQLDYQKYNDQSLKEIPVIIKTLDKIVEEAKVKENEIDFVSIDVEGHELSVLQGFS
ncbi:MAG TPA: FkbM family methyltransferase, partial [Cyanophyceae cyanobacterium]